MTRIPKTKRAVTIREVAKQSGFSVTTVSIVLNEAALSRYIPDSTKTRIQDAAQTLGYKPNLFARSLRSNRSQTIGVMVFDITDPYCTLILRGIQNTLYDASYMPILTDVQNDPNRLQRYLEMLLSRRVEGMAIIANWLFTDIDIIGDLNKDGIPGVIIGRELKDETVSSVIVDNEAGGYLALQHLHELGHREIAFIRGPKALSDSESRWQGVRRFAAENGLKIDPKLTLDLPESSNPTSGHDASYELTSRLIMQGRKFSAVMAFDDMSALGVIRGLGHAGIQAPEECSVIGFDDIPLASLCAPTLTTIRQPMEEMGALAVEIVLKKVEATREKTSFVAVHRKVAPELVVRESTQSLH
jgi:DNA-binding LacI/PurR family transcriptional regulator